jgi:hypothetical protein
MFRPGSRSDGSLCYDDIALVNANGTVSLKIARRSDEHCSIA